MTETEDETTQEDEMPPIEIENEELAREFEKDQKKSKYITYILIFFFFCIAIYVFYSMFATGVFGELDVLSEFIDLLSDILSF